MWAILPQERSSTESFLNNKIAKLYDNHASIRKFLIEQTSFLPKHETATNRWRYYKAGETKAHTCPVCTGYVPAFDKTYCCHKCSTKVSTGAKRGPKLDLAAKASALRRQLLDSQPEYKLVKIGQNRSTFKHVCGTVFEATNSGIVSGSNTCPCLHKKLVLHTLATLKSWHRQQATGWIPIRFTSGDKEALLEGVSCGHRVKLRKFYDRRCPKCYPNIFASNVVTHKEYVSWVKKNRPKFEVLGHYENCRTKLEYRHLTCGQSFKYLPGSVARTLFRCPACAPRSCGAYVKFRHRGVEIDVRGKENIALSWILKNTNITLGEIAVDSEGTVPKIRYEDSTQLRYYKPDFYIQSRNLIVEVKDCNSIGFGNPFFYLTGKQLWDTNCTKAKACLEQGYKFNMLVFNRDNERTVLPKGWYNYSHARILKWVKQNKITV